MQCNQYPWCDAPHQGPVGYEMRGERIFIKKEGNGVVGRRIVLVSGHFQPYVVAMHLAVVDVLQMRLPEENMRQPVRYPR